MPENAVNLITKCKEKIQADHGVDEPTAYAILRTNAMRIRQTVEETARQIVEGTLLYSMIRNGKRRRLVDRTVSNSSRG